VSGVTLRSSARAEWIKFRTVPSTLYSMITMLVLTIGVGALVTWAISNHYHHLSLAKKATFDPFSSSLGGIFFAQFVVGVVGAMFITTEYSSSSIRTTLAAVPRRTLLVLSKVLVMAASILVVSEVTVFSCFLIGQPILRGGGAPTLTLGSPGVIHGVLFAGLYITLLGAMGFGFGLLLRRTPAAISLFVVIVLVVPILVAILPSNWSGPIDRFLPNELGLGMMSVNQSAGMYPPLGCALLLLGYVVGLVAVGTYLMNERDA
jgi:ABC-2 type transport system permease protein